MNPTGGKKDHNYKNQKSKTTKNIENASKASELQKSTYAVLPMDTNACGGLSQARKFFKIDFSCQNTIGRPYLWIPRPVGVMLVSAR
jgi:hypothetical protein